MTKEIQDIRYIDLYIDSRYINQFESMRNFVSYYGLLCSTLDIKQIEYSKHNDSSVSVRIITIQESLKVIDYDGLDHGLFDI